MSVLEQYARLTGRSRVQVIQDFRILKRCREDFFFFAWNFFQKGRNWIHPGARVHEFQRRAFQLIEGNERMAIIWPRGHMKTTFWAKIYPIWKLLMFPEEYQYCVCISLNEKNTKGIRLAHETVFQNRLLFSDLQYFFPYIFGVNDVRVKSNENEFTVEGAPFRIEYLSMSGELRGLSSQGRPQLIILDDIIPTDAYKSETLREFIEERYFSVIEPMGEKGSKTVILGTVIHQDDLLYKIHTGRIPGFASVLEEAYDEEAETVLWGERFTFEELAKKREEFEKAGRLAAFYREYLNRPISEDEYPFHGLEIQLWYRSTQKDATGEIIYPLNMYRVLAIDHASGVGGDDFAVVETGHDEKDRIFVLSIFASNRIDLKDRYGKVKEFIARRRPMKIVIERTSESLSFIQGLSDYLRANGIHVRIEELSPRQFGSKNERIFSYLQPRVKDGTLIVRDDMEAVIAQLRNFNMRSRDNRDDIIDALSYAVSQSRRPAPQDEELVPSNPLSLKIWKAMRERKNPEEALRWPDW